MIHFNRKILPKRELKVAISGGVDSLAGAFFLKQIGYDFTCIHFNHNQRAQNGRMENACREFCADQEIELISGICQKTIDKNIEDGLRKERLDFFSSVGGTIVLCQHLDDAVESYFANFLKGKPEHKPIPEKTEFDNFTIVRPFLRNPKEKLENFVDKHNLGKYLEADESNTDQRYERNWIRHTIIPEIESRNKGLRKVVLKKFYS